jgi:DNA-binding MarR family transcriptional regulator
MEAAGLITRQPDENDQRLTRIYLTDAGRRLQDEMNSTLADFISASFGRMTTDDLKDFERLLSSLCSIIDQELSSSGSVAVSDLDQQ